MLPRGFGQLDTSSLNVVDVSGYSVQPVSSNLSEEQVMQAMSYQPVESSTAAPMVSDIYNAALQPGTVAPNGGGVSGVTWATIGIIAAALLVGVVIAK